MSSRFLLWFLLLLALYSNAQSNYYAVFLKDKTGTPYSISNPSAFLSEQAVRRRASQGIAIVENDLPVNPGYISDLAGQGVNVLYSSRWLNAVIIQGDVSKLPSVSALPFVAGIELIAPGNNPNGGRMRGTKGKQSGLEEVTSSQLSMLGIDKMHADGYQGEGIHIAVFDSGFNGVNLKQPFADIFIDNRHASGASYNYVLRSPDVFNLDDHGTRVLSVIGASVPGSFTGGAPGATYSLYVTENISSEYRIEEYYWLLAAERADSAGVHIINSSLGYNTFDISAMNYMPAQMDGKTAVVTRAASLAASKGMLVVTSAGNEGADPNWRIVTAPADADNILAIGSVNAGGLRSGSSSVGPTSDNRIKPDLMANGVATSVVRANGNIAASSGTSFSAPLVASLAAGIWQRYPFLKNTELIELLRSTASQGTMPDNLLGYGIPNYNAAVSLMEQVEQDETLAVFPNPVAGNTLTLRPKSPQDLQRVQYSLNTIQGQVIEEGSFQFSWSLPEYTFNIANVPSSVLLLRVKMENTVSTFKIIRTR